MPRKTKVGSKEFFSKNGLKYFIYSHKECNSCELYLDKSEFYTYRHNRNNTVHMKSICKSCQKKEKKLYTDGLKDGLTYVYFLPKENYVGITSCIKNRIQSHKSRGRNVDGYEIIGAYEKATEAAIVEAVYHNNGYNGFNYGSLK